MITSSRLTRWHNLERQKLRSRLEKGSRLLEKLNVQPEYPPPSPSSPSQNMPPTVGPSWLEQFQLFKHKQNSHRTVTSTPAPINIDRMASIRLRLLEKRRKQQEIQEQQKRLEQSLEKQRLREQKLQEQRLQEQKLREQRLLEQKLEEQRLKEQRLQEQKLREQNLLEQKLNEQRLHEQRMEEQRLHEQRLQKLRQQEEKLLEKRLQELRLQVQVASHNLRQIVLFNAKKLICFDQYNGSLN
ncbi:YPF17-like protein [Mya arenaria]|uniref:YPF17-like protein n=1 Tax=Mya arenaria TaxID=6604 RepID=A0ABY7DX55_MYAAR|nr:YPF17-like protein [Mya arenaria]